MYNEYGALFTTNLASKTYCYLHYSCKHKYYMTGMLECLVWSIKRKSARSKENRWLFQSFSLNRKIYMRREKGWNGNRGRKKNIHAYHLLYNSPTTQLRCNLFSNPLKWWPNNIHLPTEKKTSMRLDTIKDLWTNKKISIQLQLNQQTVNQCLH